MSAGATTLENAAIVHHDRVCAEPLSFFAGRVSAARADAYCIDLRDHLIFPGLINAHDHLQLNGIPPLESVEAFANSYEWIDACQRHLETPGVVAATRVPSSARHWHGGLKNVLAGVTTVAHHDPWHSILDDKDFPVGLLRDFGWSHSLGLGVGSDDRPPRYGPPVGDSFAATPASTPWIIHLAEGTDAMAASELSRLDTLGALAPNTVIVHGTGLTNEDVSRVVTIGAAVVWCPASNLRILGRTCDVRRLADAHRLALGSDSRLTGSRDLLDELRVALAQSDLSASELLRIVTFDASRILRMPECGGLHAGQQADCVIVRAGSDPFDTLLGTERGDIRAVFRGGTPVIADADCAAWFAQCGVEAMAVRLDGRPKLIARGLARPDAVALEPGLELA